MDNNNNPKFHLLGEHNRDGKYRYIYNNGINIAGIKLPLDFFRLSESERAKCLLFQYTLNIIIKYFIHKFDQTPQNSF